jgi:hypothetical protein
MHVRWRELAWLVVLAALQYGCAAQPSYGGPYLIAREALADKIAEFDALRAARVGWSSSKVAVLSRDLLERSIRANRAGGAPHAAAYQRYNYVIKDGEIRVAVWTTDAPLEEVCKQASRPASAYTGARVRNATMVDFFAEETALPNRPGPALAPRRACESATPAGKTVGVLDAHTKHFLLVQKIDTRLEDYSSHQSAEAWAREAADYAGELIVDLRGCYYVINQGSGTYRPPGGRDGDFRYLLAAARSFEAVLGVAPAAVWDVSTPRIVPTTVTAPANPVGRGLDCGE